MASIGETAFNVRSKNAGPFWVTVDIFCGDEAAFATITEQLSSEDVARLFQQPVETIKRFEIPNLLFLSTVAFLRCRDKMDPQSFRSEGGLYEHLLESAWVSNLWCLPVENAKRHFGSIGGRRNIYSVEPELPWTEIQG